LHPQCGAGPLGSLRQPVQGLAQVGAKRGDAKVAGKTLQIFESQVPRVRPQVDFASEEQSINKDIHVSLGEQNII